MCQNAQQHQTESSHDACKIDEEYNCLVAKINLLRKLEKYNCVFGHALVLISVLGLISVALLASIIENNEFTHSPIRYIFIALAALPSAVGLAEKALRPALWETWYARKANALEAIRRKSSKNRQLTNDLLTQIDLIDIKFEKTRPYWGIAQNEENTPNTTKTSQEEKKECDNKNSTCA